MPCDVLCRYACVCVDYLLGLVHARADYMPAPHRAECARQAGYEIARSACTCTAHPPSPPSQGVLRTRGASLRTVPYPIPTLHLLIVAAVFELPFVFTTPARGVVGERTNGAGPHATGVG